MLQIPSCRLHFTNLASLGDRLLSDITCIFNFNPAVCHAHMESTWSDQRPSQLATNNTITLSAENNTNYWALKLQNVRHGDAVYVEALVTFHATARETVVIRWLDVTTSWEHPDFPHGDTLVSRRDAFTMTRV